MQRNKCPTCGGTDLYESKLAAQGGVAITRARKVGWSFVLVQCVACLTCGTVVPFIEDKGIAKLRDWKAKDSHDVIPGSGGGVPPPADQGDTLRLLLVIIALAAILAAVVFPMLNVAEKLK